MLRQPRRRPVQRERKSEMRKSVGEAAREAKPSAMRVREQEESDYRRDRPKGAARRAQTLPQCHPHRAAKRPQLVRADIGLRRPRQQRIEKRGRKPKPWVHEREQQVAKCEAERPPPSRETRLELVPVLERRNVGTVRRMQECAPAARGYLLADRRRRRHRFVAPV